MVRCRQRRIARPDLSEAMPLLRRFTSWFRLILKFQNDFSLTPLLPNKILSLYGQRINGICTL